jgi:hypothetical protein
MSDGQVLAESDKPNNIAILVATVLTIVAVVVMVVAVKEYFGFATQDEISAKQLAPENTVKRGVKAREQAALSKYQWVDEGKGVVRIPVDVAQKLVVRDWDKAPVAAPETVPAAPMAPATP